MFDTYSFWQVPYIALFRISTLSGFFLKIKNRFATCLLTNQRDDMLKPH